MSCNSIIMSNNLKVNALETTLRQSLFNFQELILDFEKLYTESENYKKQLATQKEKCESNKCNSAEALKRTITSKDNIIQLVASTLTTLNETKNLNILNDIFKILCGDTSINLSSKVPNKNLEEINDIKSDISLKEEQVDSITEEVSINEDSISEIEGTPGRTSPIIPSRKSRNTGNSSDFRDKKKCPDNWPTPEKKAIKLSYPTPSKGKGNGKLRQSRLNLVKVKQTNFVDLTCSPEFSGGCRTPRSNSDCHIQPLIKKESIENDDTILPSPTSAPTNFIAFKTAVKDSPSKFKKPQLCLKLKTEHSIKQEFKEVIPSTDITEMEDSINLLNQLPNRFKKKSPMKNESVDEDKTHCETDYSMSLLKHIDNLEQIHRNEKPMSPTKRPLVENINVTNVPNDSNVQLKLEPTNKLNAVENIKPKLEESLYKEPTVRKKLEKKALPGWSCEECKNFFGELYKDDPEMLAKKIEECSKHRGRNNPIRPKTPPGFWNPRWTVPDDTEEFNKMNDVH